MRKNITIMISIYYDLQTEDLPLSARETAGTLSREGDNTSPTVLDDGATAWKLGRNSPYFTLNSRASFEMIPHISAVEIDESDQKCKTAATLCNDSVVVLFVLGHIHDPFFATQSACDHGFMILVHKRFLNYHHDFPPKATVLY